MKLRGLYANYRRSDKSLASGGQAVLFDVPGTPWLFKQFKSPPQPEAAVHDLRVRLRELSVQGQMVFLQRGRKPGDSDEASFCWPVDVVENGGVPVGTLIPKASAPFYRGGGDRLRTLEFLYLYRTDPPNSYLRVRVLLQVLRAFALLGDMHLVHGDVAPKNIVWATLPSPSVFVLDVDGVRREGVPYWDYVQTPEWEDPRVSERVVVGHDLYSDWYALGLLVVRTLLCSRYLVGKEPPDVAALDDYLPDAIAAALRTVLTTPSAAAVRPRPQEWADLLVQHFFAGPAPGGERFARADLAMAQRRRWERRSGHLGPPYSELSVVLKNLL